MNALILAAAVLGAAALAGCIAARPWIHPVRLRHLAKKGSRSARLLERALIEGNRCLAALWLGLGCCLAVQVAVMTHLVESVEHASGKLAWAVICILASWIFVWLLPAALFRKFPLRLARRCAPLVWLVNCFSHPLTRMLPVAGKPPLRSSMRDSFVKVAQENALIGGLTRQQAGFLVHLVDYSTTRIRDLMIPVNEVVVVDESLPVSEALALAHPQRMDRLILRNADGRWVGYFDVLAGALAMKPRREAAAFSRRMLSVGGGDLAFPVLRKLRASRMALATVTDDAGNPTGVVFAADIIRGLMQVAPGPKPSIPQK